MFLLCIEPEPIKIITDKQLLEVVDATNTPVEVLQAVGCFVGVMSPELAVACIHHIYAKNNMTYERNSDMYNQVSDLLKQSTAEITFQWRL